MMLVALVAGGCGAAAQRPPAPAQTPTHATTTAAAKKPPRRVPPGACYGAAARARGHVCNDPRFTTMVYPAPRVAPSIISQSPCRRTIQEHLIRACWWGAAQSRARRTVGLIGDSHASVWRPAFEDVVHARHWRAVSISRAGCPLTRAHPALPGPDRPRQCMEWGRQVVRWLGRHRRVSVVFLAAHPGHVVPRPHQSFAAAKRAGYAGAIRAVLAAGVARVVALRDTPRNPSTTARCIENAVAADRAPGAACAVPRVYALRADPLAQAAHSLHSPRASVIDLSRLMCDRAACPPVIGGVLVLRDGHHMTDAFSKTLGPFLLRAVDRLRQRWSG